MPVTCELWISKVVKHSKVLALYTLTILSAPTDKNCPEGSKLRQPREGISKLFTARIWFLKSQILTSL